MLYGTNELVTNYNNRKMEQLEGATYKSEAMHLNNPGWKRTIKKNGLLHE